MTRRPPAGLAACLTLTCAAVCAVIGTADEAHAQFGWSFSLGPWRSSYYFGYNYPSYSTGYYPSYSSYYPSYSSYYAGYTPSYSYTASYAPMYTASYYAPSCVTCASPCVTCGVPTCTGCAVGTVGCAAGAVTAGTAGAVAGAPGMVPPGVAAPGMGAPGAPTTCRKCTIDDAQVYSGPQGLMYIDGERGFVQMEWGGRLRYAELAFTRQDDDFRYYEQLPPPGETATGTRPLEWSVALRPCSQCKHAIWHNYDQSGARGWTKVESAEIRCVTPLTPPSTSPNTSPDTQERRRPSLPNMQDDGYELERREKQSDGGRDSGWTTVPQRRSERSEGNLAWISAESDPLPALTEAPAARYTTTRPTRLAGHRESSLRVSRAERLRD